MISVAEHQREMAYWVDRNLLIPEGGIEIEVDRDIHRRVLVVLMRWPGFGGAFAERDLEEDRIHARGMDGFVEDLRRSLEGMWNELAGFMFTRPETVKLPWQHVTEEVETGSRL